MPNAVFILEGSFIKAATDVTGVMALNSECPDSL